jgi:hypothetical protein
MRRHPARSGTNDRRSYACPERHDILRRATDAGRKNEPSTADTHLDEMQRELIEASQDFVAAAMRRAGAEFTERCNRIRVKSAPPLDTALEEENRRPLQSAVYKDDALIFRLMLLAVFDAACNALFLQTLQDRGTSASDDAVAEPRLRRCCGRRTAPHSCGTSPGSDLTVRCDRHRRMNRADSLPMRLSLRRT